MEESAAFTRDLLSNNEGPVAPAKKQRTRSVKNAKFEMYTDDAGSTRPMDPKLTQWYQMYVTKPTTTSPKFCKKFRRRFRLPYQSFLGLVDLCKDAEGEPYFRRWLSCDAVGKPSSPLELMLLGALRYLGRGWTFDDIEEATCIDEETHRQFFEVFITFGSEVLFPKYVSFPKNAAEAEEHMHEMRQAGFHGCPCSTDATHIMMERCRYLQRQAHMGFKMSHPARTYNMTVNHRRKILWTTPGHPSRWNDKTVVLFDKFVRGIHEGEYLSDVEFELHEFDMAGNVVNAKYRGAWVMVDNGYLPWSITQAPIKSTLDMREIRWSQWLESMRKDVECTFGILKGRWRILKAGVRVHGVEKCDKIWHTCCALHNWLLDVDGLDRCWMNGVPSDWEGEMGQQSPEDVERYSDPTPQALERLRSPATSRGYDTSGMGPGEDIGDSAGEMEVPQPPRPEATDDSTPPDGVRVVRKLSSPYFRRKLVEHLNILWQRKELCWPSRVGMRRRPTYP